MAKYADICTPHETIPHRLCFNFHEGQLRAWESKKRTVAMIAGTQGGKTSFGVLWLWNEIKQRGPGDYMVVTPTYKLLELKCLPEFKKHFERRMGLGRYLEGKSEFRFSPAGLVKMFGLDFVEAAEDLSQIETRVIFGHASNPDSLESATAMAVWADEAGQDKFKIGSKEALDRRLSLNSGRMLITTTPYNLGWLKQKIYDPWIKANKDHPEIDVIQFKSIHNPNFPIEEYNRAKATLPDWKFRMFYDAVFARPEGLIYSAFDEIRHKIPRRELPKSWGVYVGVDFGGVNTAATFYAADPDSGDLYLYATYKAGGRTASGHSEKMEELLEGRDLMLASGGAPSEDQWRDEFDEAGFTIERPLVGDVEVGIDRVIRAHKLSRIYVFDDLDEYLEEKSTYRRKLDENSKPTEEIANKNDFHLMDSERYIISSVRDTSLSGVEDLADTQETESKF